MSKRQTFIVDASYNPESKVTGLGIAVHETDLVNGGRNGVLIAQLSEAYVGIPDGHGEMLALYRALAISQARGYKIVRLRSDFNPMRKALKKSYDAQTDFDRVGLYGEVLRLARELETVQFGYKPRRKNQMAHQLSRVGSKAMVPVKDDHLIQLCSASSPRLTPQGR